MTKPKASESVVRSAAQKAWNAYGKTGPLPDHFVLMVRGYYRDTMGDPGKNDVGIYDDAAFILTTHGMTAWNANTDPSRYGWNPGAGKYMARLKPGIYAYRALKHHPSRPDGYMAFGQGDNPVTVQRIKQDRTIVTEETGCFGINLHRGGRSGGTSSEGCLTIPVEQWQQFHQANTTALASRSTNNFPLVLIEGPIV
jgi:lysozyme